MVDADARAEPAGTAAVLAYASVTAAYDLAEALFGEDLRAVRGCERVELILAVVRGFGWPVGVSDPDRRMQGVWTRNPWTARLAVGWDRDFDRVAQRGDEE